MSRSKKNVLLICCGIYAVAVIFWTVVGTMLVSGILELLGG
jgi:hypothetical protein